VDDEALVLATADRIDAVAAFDFERDRAAVDLGDRYLELDGHAEQRSGEVIELDAGSYRVLAWIEMLEQQLARDHFDVAYQPGCRVNAGLFAHEADGAIAVDRELGGGAHPGGQGRFHRILLKARETSPRGAGSG